MTRGTSHLRFRQLSRRSNIDDEKIDALGRAFRSGVTDSASRRVAFGGPLWAHWSADIDLLHVVACEEPLLWSEQHDQANESKDARPCVVHCWSDEAAAALARGDASSGAHAPHSGSHGVRRVTVAR